MALQAGGTTSEGAVHEDLLAYDPIAYEEHVVAFLRRYLAAQMVSDPLSGP
jgi:hypothetical protein